MAAVPTHAILQLSLLELRIYLRPAAHLIVTFIAWQRPTLNDLA
jgi:hypothetical protein